MIRPSGRKGGNSVQIKVNIDAAAQETKVIIQAPCMTEEVPGILRLLSEKENKMIAGFKGDTVSILEEDAIAQGMKILTNHTFPTLPFPQLQAFLRGMEAAGNGKWALI